MTHRALKIVLLATALASLAAPRSLASSLSLKLRSTSGQDSITVEPGARVRYLVIGELNDEENDGLAMFCFDLAFEGRPLKRADVPAAQPMLNFAIPLGVNNPGGFNGTPKDGKLLQVGGAQNTINNTLAPFPVGTVIPGVAKRGRPVVLVTGTLAAPLQPGSYQLSASALVANVIKKGATGTPFWECESAVPGPISSLTIVVKGARPIEPNKSGAMATPPGAPRLVARRET